MSKVWKEWAGFPGSVTAKKCGDTSVFGWFLPAGICSRYSRNYARNVQLSCLPQPCRAHIITAYLAAGRRNGEYRGLITAAEGLDNRRKGVVSHELLRFRRACSRFFHRFIRISSASLRPPPSLLNLLLTASGTYLSAALFTPDRRELLEILVARSLTDIDTVSQADCVCVWSSSLKGCFIISTASCRVFRTRWLLSDRFKWRQSLEVLEDFGLQFVIRLL